MDGIERMMKKLNGGPDEFWLQVINTMNEALVVVDSEKRLVFMNPKAEEITGRALSDVRGLTCTEAISCPQCNCTCRLFERGEFSSVDVVVYAPGDGRRKIYRKNGRLLRARDGTVIGGVETFQDVTEEVEQRQQNQQRVEQLFAERNRFRSLLEGLAEGVFAVDENMKVVEFSRRLEQITGYGAEAAMGAYLPTLFGIEILKERLSVNRPSEFDCSLRTAGGGFVPVRIRLVPQRYGNVRAIGVVMPTKQPQFEGGDDSHGILTRSESMKRVLEMARSAAGSELNVLIEGESGTGKELVARAIHNMGPRRKEPFYAVNCATFTGSLLLSELFGHEKGAFTGAVARKLGKFELAGAGTLLLDEVGEIPLQHQALLLRVLEQRTFERLGGQRQIPFRARIIAATNRDLERLRREGAFREDLYYRLRVIPIRLPPLRERPEDIELLANTFLSMACRSAGTGPKHLTKEVLEIIRAYRWPGNVRELKNLMEYLAFLPASEITAADLPAEITECVERPRQRCRELNPAGERQRILEALERARWNRGRAARLLGIDRSTLYRRMKKLGIAS